MTPVFEAMPIKLDIAGREARPGEPIKITEAIEWDHDRLDRLERTALDLLYPITDSVLELAERDALVRRIQLFPEG